MEHLHNGRSYLRQDVIVLLQYSKLTGEAYEAVTGKEHNLFDRDLPFQTFTLQPFMEDTAEEGETRNIDPFVIKNLIDINLKLNLIFTMFSSNREPSVFDQRPMEVNLSGGGIAFVTSEQFEKGDILDLKILLPVFPISLIRTRGEVVRSKPLLGNSWETAVKFIGMHEENQDKIVHYIFKKERESIRNKKPCPEGKQAYENI